MTRQQHKTVAMLFGRKGSTGFPGKNTYPILGRPAMLYPLMAAIHSKHVDTIYVSTDDPAIADLARQYGAEVIDRPPELCTKEALLEDAIQHAYHEIKSRLGYEPPYIVILMCNALNILADTIDQGVDFLDKEPDFDSVISACKLNMFHPFRARRITDDGTLQPFVPFESLGDPTKMNSSRTARGDAFFADGGMTVVRGSYLNDISPNLLPFRWMGNRIHMIEQPVAWDIDEPWQVSAVEHWLDIHGFTEESTPYSDSLVSP